MKVALVLTFLTMLVSDSVAAVTLAIVGGRVHSISSMGVIEKGTVLIEEGRIAAVGANLAIPRSARVIDARGTWITPGIFNAYTKLGLTEVWGAEATRDDGASGSRFPAAFDVSYGINSESTLIPVTRMAGVTRSAVFPTASSSVFAGYGAFIHLGTGYDLVFKKKALALVELGQSGAEMAGGARGAAWIYLLSAFDEVQKSASQTREAMHDPVLPRIDRAALVPVLAGEIPLVVHVERVPDILNCLELKRQYPKLRLALLGASAGWKVANQIAREKVPVILDAVFNVPLTFENLGATEQNAARLAQAGVTIAITPLHGPDATYNARLIPQVAGNAVANGLDWPEALRAITLNPARIFGVSDRLGSLEPGKIADVAMWDGDPLEIGTTPRLVLIAGEEVSLVSRQSELRDRYTTPRLDARRTRGG